MIYAKVVDVSKVKVSGKVLMCLCRGYVFQSNKSMHYVPVIYDYEK